MSDLQTALADFIRMKSGRDVDQQPGQLSTYEEFTRAGNLLREEQSVPAKRKDFNKIKKLENLRKQLSEKLQWEVSKYKRAYPQLSHEELSRKALLDCISRQNEEAKIRENIRIREEQVDNEILIEKAEQKKALENLAEQAKSTVREYSVIRCGHCKNGYVTAKCAICNGTGQVAPHNRKIYQTIGCCYNPSCQKCGGQGVYTAEVNKWTTECENCKHGNAVEKCEFCNGFAVSTKEGPLPSHIIGNSLLMGEISRIMGISKVQVRGTC